MQQTIDNAKRGFLKWICRLTGGYLFLSLSPAPLKRVNATLFSEAHGQTGCKTDWCTERDACEGDSVGHTCYAKDTCNVDESGGCETDSCDVDRSGACITDSCNVDESEDCVTDSCDEDRSGVCKVDRCVSDSSSGGCGTDSCNEDRSGGCVTDSCDEDRSGGCVTDRCVSDRSGICSDDSCNEDRSGDCVTDSCNEDWSGFCVNDSCIIDKSGSCGADLCRQDQGPDCATSDTCALDRVTGMRPRQQTLASKSLNRAMKWLYDLAMVILCIFTASLAHGQNSTVIDAINAILSPNPTFITAAPVSIDQPAGPFLRDCDGDGILEADTNGDGQCAGDPKVMDYRGIGTRELPPGTPFTGTFTFTCFHIPEDVAITATGPLNITASREVAIFGAMRLSDGIKIATPVDIDARLSTWLSDAGEIILSTALKGDAYNDLLPIELTDEQNLPSIQYTSTCDTTTETAIIRAIFPPEVTQGSAVTIKGSNLGIKKGKVALGSVKAKVNTWTPDTIFVEFKKVPTVAGPYDSFITPSKTPAIRTEAAYQVKAPEVLYVSPGGGRAGDVITITGKFFGKKKGKLILNDKKCKITAWTMDARTGASEVEFVVPKKLATGSATLTLSNKVGSFARSFTVYDPM